MENKRLTVVRTNPPIYDDRYKFVCPIESDCGAFEENNSVCFECGVHKHIAKLAAYEDAEEQGRILPEGFGYAQLSDETHIVFKPKMASLRVEMTDNYSASTRESVLSKKP